MNIKRVHDPVTDLPLLANKSVYRYYIMNIKHVHDPVTDLPLQASESVYRYYIMTSGWCKKKKQKQNLYEFVSAFCMVKS